MEFRAVQGKRTKTYFFVHQRQILSAQGHFVFVQNIPYYLSLTPEGSR